MRRIVLAGLLLAATPLMARAADLNAAVQSKTVTVEPPAGQPHAYTPAPVPSVGGPATPPANRAGNANDAGPINSTPLSSSLSPSLGVGVNARAAQQTDPTADNNPSLAGHD